MAMELDQPGLRTLYLMQILMERTDEEHALNAAEISSACLWVSIRFVK